MSTVVGASSLVPRSSTGIALARLTVRQIRRGALLLAFALAAYAVVEVYSYRATYPDAASRARLTTFQDNPAVRMLQGIPHAVDTPGGFVAWDAGWLLAWIAGIWALLATVRLLRGEEESERAELVLSAPIPTTRATARQLLVVAAASALAGATLAVALAASGAGVAGSVVFGAGLAGITAISAGIAAVAAQVFRVGHRASTAAAGVLGVLFLVRMIANSGTSRGWLRWATPFGWMDELHAFGDPRPAALAALLATPLLLGALALRLRAIRDTGGALSTTEDRRPARLGLLASPLAFTWRTTYGMVASWGIGIAGYAAVMGVTVKSVTEFIASDPNYSKVLATLGWSAAEATRGYLGIMGGVLGLLLCTYVGWRVGVASKEETTGRLDNHLSRPVSRRRWLLGHTLVAVVTAAAIAVAAGLVMWAGAAATAAGITATDALGAIANFLPVVAVFAGMAVLIFGLRPRLTVPLTVSAAVTAYLVQLLGTALKWPGWALDLSPFHHLATVPVDPVATLPAILMTCIGIAAAAVGVTAFEHRDLVGE
ncbi:MAG TPA: hypothetical protein VFN97_06850 [Actinospica sp.]|nr:hypothetical protein [Actinospica sp.]